MKKKYIRYIGLFAIVVVAIVLIYRLKINIFSIDKQNQLNTESIDTQSTSDKQKIFSDVGGFLTTEAMLDKRIDQIFFPGTHNSFSNNSDADHDYQYSYSTGTLNQDKSIKSSLENGIRYIDVDLGRQDSKSHTQSYHRVRKIKVGVLGLKWMGNTSIFNICNSIIEFLNENTKEIVFLNISDIYNDADVFDLSSNVVLKSDISEYYTHINRFLRVLLKDKGMYNKTYNFFGSDTTSEDELYKYILGPGMEYNNKTMTEWPKLGDMINQNKRLIILLPTNRLNVSDENTARKMTTTGSHYLYKGSDESKGGSSINTANRINPFNISSNPDTSKKLFLVHEWPDGGASAGWRESSRINNEGRRIYQLIKGYDVKFNSEDYVNFIDLDFFQPNSKKGGLSTLDVDVVDAANRINFENCGFNWTDMQSLNPNYYWSDYSDNNNRIDTSHMKINVDGVSENPWPYRPYHDLYVFGKGAEALLDGNVWSGYDSDTDINNKPFTITFDKLHYVNKVALNFIPNSNESVSAKITVKSEENQRDYITKVWGTNLNREISWYSIDLPGRYPAKEISITLYTSKGGKQFKEIAIYGEPCDSNKIGNAQCVDDGYVKRGDPYGHHVYNNDRIEVSWDEGHEHRRYGYVKFNISNFENVDNATLRFYAHNVQSDSSPIKIYQVKRDDWKEDSLTWDNIRNDTGEYINSFTVDNDGWYEIDVTSFVKSKVNNSSEYISFHIAIPSGNKDDVEFKSKEVKDFEPTLQIFSH